MMKLHQLYSGTIKFESGNKMVLDYSKAEFIKDYFKNKKIAIFYKFTAELEALKIIFDDSITTSIDEFKKQKRILPFKLSAGERYIIKRS